MTIAAVVANAMLFLLTCALLLTEGPSKGGGYVALTALMLIVPILSAAALLRGGPKDWPRSRVKQLVAVANLALLGFLVWAMVVSYPYSEGDSVIGFAAVCVVAPVLTLLALLRPGGSLKTAA
jgi:hypothetical protein